jgi:putative chitinase
MWLWRNCGYGFLYNLFGLSKETWFKHYTKGVEEQGFWYDLKIFKKYFPNSKIALQYEKKPEKIASLVYANRMGNGSEASGDGFNYRGRGYIQLTGKSNYQLFDKTVPEDITSNPDLVATKYPLASAAFFFNNNKLWVICDKGADVATVTAVTKRVNGGTIGLPDRIKHFNEYYKLLV